MRLPLGASVRTDQLTSLRTLGVGGQGKVTLVEAPSLFPGRLAFKEYLTSTRDRADLSLLHRLVELPATCDDELRVALDEHTAWPVATVHDGIATCGFLMRAAPQVFAAELLFPSGPHTRPLAMEFLLNPPEYMHKVGLKVTERIRVRLLREMAVLLATMHRGGIVVGDLSPRNILVALDPPRCFLLDCDAMTVAGESVLPQAETPDWELPPGEERATTASDRYKFGLLAVRLLLSDQSAADPAALRAGRPAVAKLAPLAARSFGDPDMRPDWEDWIAALDEALPLSSQVAEGPPLVPPGGAEARAGSFRRTTATLMGVLAVLLALLVWTTRVDRDATSSTSGGDHAAPAVRPEDRSTFPRPAAVGLVNVEEAGDDPATIAVAGFFDAYFQAVNAKDWEFLSGLYGADGVADVHDPRRRSSWTEALSTTRDDEIRLLAVDSRTDPVIARLTFVSSQAAGYGPRDRPRETCTRWDVTFELGSDQDAYRLLRARTATHQPC